MKKGLTVVVREHADLWRSITAEERSEWYASPASRGIDCAGESKLPPMSAYRRDTSGTFTVIRARVNAPRGWHSVPKCSEIMDTDGAHWFCRRGDLHSLTPMTPTVSKMAPARDGLDREIEEWVAKVNAKFPGGGGRTIEWGRKYAKVMRDHGVYCFVVRSNGDIMKAANMRAPAKHARGNIRDTDPLAGIGPYGAAYLR
jgi:hypothetical protein